MWRIVAMFVAGLAAIGYGWHMAEQERAEALAMVYTSCLVMNAGTGGDLNCDEVVAHVHYHLTTGEPVPEDPEEEGGY